MSRKIFLCGLRGLRGSKYKKPISAIHQDFVNLHRDFPPKPVKSGDRLNRRDIVIPETPQ
jgi:hypothetical protein